jgi:hypothetical protein
MNRSKWILSLVFALSAVRAEAQPRRVQPGNPGADIINRALQGQGVRVAAQDPPAAQNPPPRFTFPTPEIPSELKQRLSFEKAMQEGLLNISRVRMIEAAIAAGALLAGGGAVLHLPSPSPGTWRAGRQVDRGTTGRTPGPRRSLAWRPSGAPRPGRAACSQLGR